MITKYLKNIFIIIIFTFPMIICASSGLNYQDTIRYVNNYIYQYPKYNNYIYLDDGIGYNYENGEIKYNSDFKSGGLLSKTEYEISNKNNNTFLSNGLEYWTLTKSSANRHYVVNYRLQEKNDDEVTGVRLTEYVNNNIGVVGTGSYANPWVFSELRNLHINSLNVVRGNVSSTDCSNGAKKESITLTYTKDLGANFSICPEDGYRVYTNSCSAYTTFQGGNKYYISSVPRDDMICNIDYTYITERVNLIGCLNGNTNPSPNVIYANKVHKKWFIDDDAKQPQISKINTIPQKTGYTFQGYFIDSTEVVDRNGNLRNNAASLMYNNINLSATCTPNTYNITLSISDATSTNHTKNGSVVYDNNLPAITIPKREYTVTYDYNGGSGSVSSDIAGYNFDGYYYNSTQYYNGSGGSARKWNIANDATLVGKWSGGTVNLPSATREGYRFDGWYNGSTRVTNSTAITSNVTLKAKWTDITSPECVLVADASGVSFGSKTDNVRVTEYGITTSSTASYNSKNKLSLSINTFYGHVKDAAGNTSRCSISIGGTYADTYNKTTKTCNRTFVNYTKTTKTCNRSISSYTKTTQTCNRSVKNYSMKSKTCLRSIFSRLCVGNAKEEVVNFYAEVQCKKTGYNCTARWDGVAASGLVVYSCTCKRYVCEHGTLSGKSCSYSTSGYCASGYSADANGYIYSYDFGNEITSNNLSSCSSYAVHTCNEENYLKTNKVCITNYDYFFNESTRDDSSCTVGSSFTCSSSKYGSSYVSKCIENYNYSLSSSNSFVSSCAVENSFTCNSSNYDKSYVSSCSSNYNYFWNDNTSSSSSCSEESSFSCDDSNYGDSYVSDCTPTSYSCSGSGYTKINDSYCYK